MGYFINTDLLDFPFGWNDIYQQALKEYPNGRTNVEFIKSNLTGNEPQITVYTTDPVAYREMLLREYRAHRSAANSLIHRFRSSGDLSLLSDIIAEDIRLYILACNWCSEFQDPGDSADFLNPSDFLASEEWQKPSRSYFANHIPDPWRKLLDYRLIDWTLEFPRPSR